MESPPNVDARRAAGRSARADAPLEGQAALPSERVDSLEVLRAQDATRLRALVPIRYGRMSASPFTFLRGSAAVMAADLAATPNSGITAQLCGDAHVSNFGVFAGPDRRLLFDINDFDETHPGPFEWDVKRLAASIVVAARDRGFDDATAVEATRRAVAQYREAIHRLADVDPLEVWYGRIEFEELLPVTAGKSQKLVAKAARKARGRTAIKALGKLTTVVDGRRQIVADPPLVVPARKVEDAPDEAVVAAFFEAYRASLGDDVRSLLDRYAYLDFALKVVGVGSVGTRAIIALLEDGDGAPLFLQLKEAGRSVLEPFTAPGRYEHGGQRVVAGQRLMQAASDIFLGWARAPRTGIDFYVRQLRDMKGGIEIEALDEKRFVGYARLCADTLARAHARGGDPAAIDGYVGEDDAFDGAVAEWALGYADVTERDHAALTSAIDAGTIAAVRDI